MRFVPEGTGPKVYCIVCENKSDWDEIHNYIINENEIDNIPNRRIECINLKKLVIELHLMKFQMQKQNN